MQLKSCLEDMISHMQTYQPISRFYVKQTLIPRLIFLLWRVRIFLSSYYSTTYLFHSITAMWKGFLAGCRPLIGVDGTHLKETYGCILLSAVALDANNEIFSLACAVVSVEDKENWSWFF